MSRAERERRARRRWPGALVAAVVLALAAAGAVALLGDDAPLTGDDPAPSPSPTGPSPTAPSPSPASEPTREDAEAFAAAYAPAEGELAAAEVVDLDDDARLEVVAASVADRQARVDVAVWGAERGEYAVVATGRGGGARAIDRLRVGDLTGGEGREIVTEQSVGERGESLSIWGWRDGGLERQPGEGGCWDGSHTFGITGAEIEPGEIVATCDGSPLPPASWPSDAYVWDGGVWRYERSMQP